MSLARDKFYVPGSVLRVAVDRRIPLTWGLGDAVDVMFSASPTFRLPAGVDRLRRVAWYRGQAPLRSGWAWGQGPRRRRRHRRRRRSARAGW